MDLIAKEVECFEAGIEAVMHIVRLREKKGKAKFDRLDEDKKVPFVVPKVTWDRKTQSGSLHNSHWKFDVPYGFREALDLIAMERMRNKKRVLLWTQGPIISFKEGDLINSKCGNRSVQVKFANPMGWDADNNQMYYGSVTFHEYEQVNGHMRKVAEKNLSQLDFLKMLING